MKTSQIACGDDFITVTLPDRTQILEPPPFAPLENLKDAIRSALYSPIAHDRSLDWWDRNRMLP